MERARRRERVLARVGAFGLGRTQALMRGLGQVDRFLRGVLDAGLGSDEARSLLTTLVYDGSPHYRGLGLFDWEEQWFRAELPSAPASVLVGGCGAGRELVWLVEQGYRVVGLEPAPGLAALARRRFSGRVFELSYEELSAKVLDGGGVPPEVGEGFDAVLLGWGSVVHVLSRGERERLFRACDRLCPRGPILGSFPTLPEAPEGKAYRVGSRLGAALSSGTGLPPVEEFRMLPWTGYLARITEKELSEFGAQVGRGAELEACDVYPHFTMRSPRG